MRQGVSLSCGLADWQGLRAGPRPQAVVQVEGIAASEGIDAALIVLRARRFSPVSFSGLPVDPLLVYLAVLVALQLDPSEPRTGARLLRAQSPHPFRPRP